MEGAEVWKAAQTARALPHLLENAAGVSHTSHSPC